METPTQSSLPIATRRRGWAWLGLAGGLGLGLADYLAMRWMGVSIQLGEVDLFNGLLCMYAVTYAAFGFFLGRLWEARQDLRRERLVIQSQMKALEQAQQKESASRAAAEASRVRALQLEKLASIGRLAAGVAHDVRNPLAVIRSSAELLFESIEQPDGTAERSHDFIREEVDRLDDYIARLLQFARPVQAKRAEFDVAELAERVLHLTSEQAERDSVELVHRVDARPAVGDPDLLAQLLLALTVNAVQAAASQPPPHPTTPRPASESSAPTCATPESASASDSNPPFPPSAQRVELHIHFDGSALIAEVADTGPGLSAEAAERLFEPFFTDKAQGTGLGLAMALKLAEAMDGELSVLSGAGLALQGRGARLRLRIPNALPDTAPAPPKAEGTSNEERA